jgi:hypothetical protein
LSRASVRSSPEPTPDLSPSRKRSLADGTRRIRWDLPVLERALKDRSEQGERVADRNTAVAGGEPLRLQRASSQA